MPSDVASSRPGPAGWWACLPRRGLVSVTGPDAATFVDHFTTASVAGLMPGRSVAGLFCDARGQVLVVTMLVRTADGLLLLAGGDQGASLATHLERYHIREQLHITNVTEDFSAWAFVGFQAAGWLQDRVDRPLPQQWGDHDLFRFMPSAGESTLFIRVVRVDWFGDPCWLVLTTAVDREVFHESLEGVRSAEMSRAELDAGRLVQGWPEPHDLPAKTLPQELGRDDRFICFSKGCYLGQETVARIDALGHVNRRLAVLVVQGGREAPPDATQGVVDGGAMVAEITSAAWSPVAAAWLVMAMLPAEVFSRTPPFARLLVDGRAVRLFTPITAPPASPCGAFK